MGGAKEGGAFLDEFRAAGFAEAAIMRTSRNMRTAKPGVLAAEVLATKALDQAARAGDGADAGADGHAASSPWSRMLAQGGLTSVVF